jgi:hypothetical protein
MAEVNDTRGPTQADRLRLAQAHQARSLRRPDPLLATIGVLNGDMMAATHRLLEAALAEAGADGAAQAGPGSLLYLHTWMKGVAQVARFTNLERRLAAGPAIEPPVAAPPSEERRT